MQLRSSVECRTYILFVLVVFAVYADAQRGDSVRAKQKKSHAFMKALEDEHLLAGQFAVHYGGKVQYAGAYGLAVPELGVPIKVSDALWIGSNTKFFVGVALWQLQAKGLINLDDPVYKYMDKADFNQTTDWCPRLYGSNLTECIYPTLKQLLDMSSGLVATFNCDYPEGSWQLDYCLSDDMVTNLIDNSPTQAISVGNGPARYFAAQQFWNMPLEAMPGTEYHYVNANHELAAYVVEKISGLGYGRYLATYILGPANLTSMNYVIADGNYGVPGGCVPNPPYRSVFSPVSKEFLQKVNSTTNLPLEPLLNTPAGKFVMNARNYDVPGFLAMTGGSGAMCASVVDVFKWWHTVLYKPEVLGLNTSYVRTMLGSYNNVSLSGFHFSQAIVVLPNATYEPFGVEAIMYIGGTPGDVVSPFFLRFLDPKNGSIENTIMVGGISTLAPDLQVPWNRTSCEVADWRNNGTVTKLSDNLCAAVNAGGYPQSSYPEKVLMTNLMNIWDAPTGEVWSQFGLHGKGNARR